MKFIQQLVSKRVDDQGETVEALDMTDEKPTATVHPLYAPEDEAAADMVGASDDSDLVKEPTVKSMWEMVTEPDVAIDAAPPMPEPEIAEETPPAPPVAEKPSTDLRPQRRVGRVKTRLLGFEHADGQLEDLGDKPAAKKAPSERFPVAYLVIAKGPGRGEPIAVKPGVSQIGRGEDQGVSLDFGDTSISRENHAILAYDDESREFYLGHGGKSNLVKLNGKPVLSTELVKHGDMIRIGETTLMFVAVCGENFSWSENAGASKTDE